MFLPFLKILKLSSCVVLSASLLMVPARSYAASDAYYISLQSVLLFSLHESSKTKIAAEKEAQAGYSVDEAKAAYYPDIQVLAEVGREYNSPASFEEQPESGAQSNTNNSLDVNLTLRQMLFDRTKTTEILRREQLLNSKSIESGLVEQDLIEDSLNAYIDVLSAQKNAYLSHEMLEAIELFVDKIRHAYDAGAESQAKYDYAFARLSLAESKASSALSAYQDATSRLESLTGPLPDFLAIEPEELAISDYDLSFYTKLAAQKNSEVQLADSNISATKVDFEKQKAAYLPKVNFLLEAGQSYDKGGEIGSDRDASAMVQMQYDLFKGFSRRAAKNRVASKIRELEYSKDDLLKDVNKDVKISFNEIKSLKQNIALKKQEVLSYLSLRNISRKSLEIGEVDLFQSIENEENIHDALSQMHQSQSDIYKKSYNLLKLIGALKKQKFCESC